MGILKRSLDNSLIQWIMAETGLGPGVGQLFYVAPAVSATSQYRTQLTDMGVEVIDALPSAAFNRAVAYRNDVVLVAPGTYTEESSLDWSKSQTHLLGIGNPTWRQGGKVRIQTTGIAIEATVDVTASGVFFGGLNITQNGANAACLTGLRLSSTYFGAKKLDIRGFLNSEVAAIEAASCLEFADGSSYGFGSTFVDCNIGTMSGPARTATGAACNGVILFAKNTQDGSPSAYTEFHNCRVLSRCEAAGGAMIKVLDARWGMDRLVYFKDCLVANYWLNYTDNLDGAIYLDTTTGGSGKMLLSNCDLAGVDQWQTQDSGNVFATMPIVGVGGGIEREPTAATGS